MLRKLIGVIALELNILVAWGLFALYSFDSGAARIVGGSVSPTPYIVISFVLLTFSLFIVFYAFIAKDSSELALAPFDPEELKLPYS